MPAGTVDLKGKEESASDAPVPLELQNWLALYAATGVCCALAISLSVTETFVEFYRERTWTQALSLKRAAMLLPRTWWRWPKLYLLSTRVTLGIVGFFAATLSWGCDYS